MPITLGCPSCGKRFRARDESAGKRVKCPYCQAAVQVPMSDEADPAGASAAPLAPPSATDSGPLFPTSPARPTPPKSAELPPATYSPPAPVVATPDDWGTEGAAPAGGGAGARGRGEPPPPMRDRRDRPRPAPRPAPAPASTPSGSRKTPEQIAAKHWASLRRGLFWVMFALFWFALPGFVEFGKAVYMRTEGPLPKGEGWIKIDGYVNTPDRDAIQLGKRDEINIAAYGIPCFIGAFALVLGRIVSSGAPRASGSRALFGLSGLLTLLAAVSAVASIGLTWILQPVEGQYAKFAAILGGILAEYWFLTGLTASGLALNRPKAARAVGFIGFVVALLVVAVMYGWGYYVKEWRPKQPNEDWLLGEKAAPMLGWLLLIVVYCRAVRIVRSAARAFIDSVGETE